jgi:hypothetical protein
MPWPVFFIADLAGTAAWVSVLVIGLYALEQHTVLLHQALSYVNPWVAAAARIALGATLYLLFWRSTSDDEVFHVSATALSSSDCETNATIERARPDSKGDSS